MSGGVETVTFAAFKVCLRVRSQPVVPCGTKGHGPPLRLRPRGPKRSRAPRAPPQGSASRGVHALYLGTRRKTRVGGVEIENLINT